MPYNNFNNILIATEINNNKFINTLRDQIWSLFLYLKYILYK